MTARTIYRVTAINAHYGKSEDRSYTAGNDDRGRSEALAAFTREMMGLYNCGDSDTRIKIERWIADHLELALDHHAEAGFKIGNLTLTIHPD